MRDASLDAFKGLLVIGMVLAHVIDFLSSRTPLLNLLTLIAGLISFSGFLFAFGYANWFAYFSRDAASARPRMWRTAGKTLLAFYASGLAFRVLTEQTPLTPSLFRRILMLSDIPPYSEFLLTFALTSGLAALLFGPLKALLEKPAAFWIITGLLLATSLLSVSVNIPQLGALIGSAQPTTFPVLQYAPWYLLGVWFARHNVRLGLSNGLVALGSTALFTAFALVRGLPSRFPPGTLWIIGPAAVLWGYLWLSRRVGWRAGNPLISVGENVLLYLLMSNLVIFALKGSQSYLALDAASVLLTTALIVAFSYFLTGIVRPRKAA